MDSSGLQWTRIKQIPGLKPYGMEQARFLWNGGVFGFLPFNQGDDFNGNKTGS